MTTLEVIGTLFALLGVWLTTRQNIWCWPVAIIAIVIYIYIFYQSRLYGDSALQGFYLIMSFYGWYEWRYGGKGETAIQLSNINTAQLLYTLLAGVAGTFIFGFLLLKTNSNVPWLDATTTAFSLVATWMMARKIVENWLYWIIIDLVYVGIYVYKGLYVTGIQYFIFSALAAYGYWQWRKEWKQAALSK